MLWSERLLNYPIYNTFLKILLIILFHFLSLQLSLTQFLAPGGGEAESSKLLIMTQFFWWLAPTQKPTKSYLIWTKDTPITQEIIRNLGAWWPNKNNFLITKKIISVLGAPCQELGAETNICIFYYSAYIISIPRT